MKRTILAILGFIGIILGYTHAQEIETGVIIDKQTISLTGENSGTQYIKAKTEILSTLSTGTTLTISGFFTKLEEMTGGIDEKKGILQNIIDLFSEQIVETGVIQSGKISKTTMDTIIMPNICVIMMFYNIPSETCNSGNQDINQNLESTTGDTNLLILILLVVILAMGGIWYRIIKRSVKVQGCILFGGLIFLLTFIFMGLDYDNIDFGRIKYVIWRVIGMIIGFLIRSKNNRKTLVENKKLETESQKEKEDLVPVRVIELISVLESAFEKKEYEKVINICNEIIDIYEKNKNSYSDDAVYKKVISLKHNGEKLLNLEKEPEDPIIVKKQNLIEVCETLFKLGKSEAGINIYKDAINEYKDDKTFYAILGRHFIDLGRQEEAIEMFNKTIEIDKYYIEAYLGKGETLHILGREEDALDTYEKALENNVNDIKILQNKGVTLYRLGKYEDALKVYDDILKQSPFYEKGLLAKGLTLIKLGKNEEGLECLDLVITKINPLNIDAHNYKGVALKNLKKYDKAIKEYDEAIKIDQNYASTYYNKACSFSNMNKSEEAIENLKRSIEINPSLKKEAKIDKDFDNIRNLDEFKRIVGEAI